jgi:hypothetical protein
MLATACAAIRYLRMKIVQHACIVVISALLHTAATTESAVQRVTVAIWVKVSHLKYAPPFPTQAAMSHRAARGLTACSAAVLPPPTPRPPAAACA